jgi:hypothetical protein
MRFVYIYDMLVFVCDFVICPGFVMGPYGPNGRMGLGMQAGGQAVLEERF